MLSMFGLHSIVVMFIGSQGIGLQKIIHFCAVNTILFSSVCFQFYARPSHTVLFLLLRVRWLSLSAYVAESDRFIETEAGPQREIIAF